MEYVAHVPELAVHIAAQGELCSREYVDVDQSGQRPQQQYDVHENLVDVFARQSFLRFVQIHQTSDERQIDRAGSVARTRVTTLHLQITLSFAV